MKRIISGKKYDTATARLLGVYEYGCPSDFRHMREELYQKRNGEFFLYGVGGPMSKYAESCGQNSWGGGEEIVPMTEGEAKTWAEENMTCSEYEEAFGEVEE